MQPTDRPARVIVESLKPIPLSQTYLALRAALRAEKAARRAAREKKETK